MNMIEFKQLGLKFIINPIAFEIFNLKVRWYGIIIATGFFLGIIIALKLAQKFNIDKELVLDFIVVVTPFSIIGARIYYVLFKFSEYKNNILEAFKTWHGGLAIYGAIIGGIIATIVYARYRKANILELADIAAPSIILGQAIGRWGNFINAEAYGRETSLPWAMTIIENGISKSVHPTFLYESILNFIIFLILLRFINYKKNNGEVFFLYIGIYSFIRFFIENLRTDSLYLGVFKVSQIVAIIFVVFSVSMFIYNRKKNDFRSI